VHIPYPFGIGPDDCSLPGFHLHCNDTGNGVLKLFYSEVEVVNISRFGMGCCRRTIPPGLRHYDVSFDDRVNPSESEFNSTNPCSYAVLLESSSFAFSTAYLTPNEFNKSNHGQAPVLLDWVVGNETCRVARTKPGYACVSSNSECVDAASGFGYLCNCTKGYQGNPYLKDPYGCKGTHASINFSFPKHFSSLIY
jgi:hypothetical protein